MRVNQVRVPHDDSVPRLGWPEVVPAVRLELLPVVVRRLLRPDDGHAHVREALHVVPQPMPEQAVRGITRSDEKAHVSPDLALVRTTRTLPEV